MRLRLIDRVRRSLGRRTARLEKTRAAESRRRASRAAGRRAKTRGGGSGDTPSQARHQLGPGGSAAGVTGTAPRPAGDALGGPGNTPATAGSPPGPAGQAPGAAARSSGAVGRAPGTGGSHRRGTAPRLVLPDGNGPGQRVAGPPRRPDGEGARPGGAQGTIGSSATRTGEALTRPMPRRWGAARAAVRTAPDAVATGQPGADQAGAAGQPGAEEAVSRDAVRSIGRDTAAAKPPWYEIAHSNRTAAGRRHCGRLEEVVRREWAPDAIPPPESVIAIDRLAELPQLIKEKLAAGLDAIHVGPGGVPDLDDMGRLSGIPLPSGRATWDACAGAYGERKIVVGSRPSPSPDVMCHEIGHALDDLDGSDEQWQSDSAEFIALYERCLPHVVSDFHQQRGILGRREFFADAFAAIASRQRPALVDMVGGDTRAALDVMLYFNVRYGI
jgi:hypothetical protein